MYVLADLLRDEITSGRIPPGTRLPSEKSLTQERGVSRLVVRQAVEILCGEGLVISERGYGTRVRERADRARVDLAAGDEAIARMPSEMERAELDVDPGTPVLEVRPGLPGRALHSGSETAEDDAPDAAEQEQEGGPHEPGHQHPRRDGGGG